MHVYELETKNGRIFRVAIENDSQMKRLSKVVQANKEAKDKYETFIRVEAVKNGIHNIKSFEALANSLV